jgi:hypothetical protein
MAVDEMTDCLEKLKKLFNGIAEFDAIIAALRAAERMRNSEDAFELRDAELAFDAATDGG